MKTPRMILAGGSGFLGGQLHHWFSSRGWEVLTLSRSANAHIHWDGRTLGSWTHQLEGAQVVINLAGRSVNCRYHARNRQAIMDSRVEATRVIGDAIARCRRPPGVWLNASTATIYQHSLDRPMDETSGIIAASPEVKDAFSVEVAIAWERTLEEAVVPDTRKVSLRSAMVLSARNDANNVYRVLRRLVRFGLGGKMGSGKQFVSWVHETDFCRAVEFIIAHNELIGPVNIAAPNPLTNAKMMATLRQHLKVPVGLPAALWMLEAGAFVLRTETELIIKSRRVIPARLLSAGFQFRYEHFDAAVCALEAKL